MISFRQFGVTAIVVAAFEAGCSDGSVRKFRISGNVGGAVAEGVTLALSGASSDTAASDANGVFSFTVEEGSYIVTPSLSGYSFSPQSRDVTVSGGDAANVNFVAAAITHSISGTVSGIVSAGVSMSLSGASSASTSTDSSGAFSFTGLAGGLYVVTPSFAGCGFTPSNRTVTVSGADVGGIDFTSAGLQTGVVQVTDDITADTTWTSDNVYVVTRSIAVDATLAVQAGTVVKFQTGAGLVVGGRILAVGTTAAPIVFTSFKDDASGGDTNDDGASSGAPADWSGIELKATGSAFVSCRLLYAGAGDSCALRVSVEGASVRVIDSTFAHHRPATDAITAAAALGLTIAGADTVVTGNLFYDNRVPLSVNTVFDLDDSNLFDNAAAAPQNPQPNEFNGVFLRGCGQASGIISWAENDVPLVVGTPACNSLSVPAYTHLTLEPGVVMKFHHDGYLVVLSGGLMTMRSGVAFTSINDDARLGDTNADNGAQAPADTDWAGVLEEDECVILPNIHYATCH